LSLLHTTIKLYLRRTLLGSDTMSSNEPIVQECDATKAV